MPKFIVDVFLTGLVSKEIEAESEQIILDKIDSGEIDPYAWESMDWLIRDKKERLTIDDVVVIYT